MSEELKSVIETGLKSVQDQLQAKMAEYNAELAKSTGQVRTELTGEIEKLAEQFKGLQTELADLAQKQGAPSAPGAFITAGQEFVKSDQFKALAARTVNQVRFEVKNTVVADSTTTFPDQRPGIIAGSFAPLTIRQLIPTINVASNAVNSLRESAWTNDAAEVAQGAAKPESDITFAPYNVVIETVAHWIKVSNQLLADAPAVAAYIDTRLRDGLDQRIDKQLLNGNGTSPNLSGLTDAGNFTAFTATSGANLVESINKAKYNRWAVGEVVDTVIVNPADWAVMELLREGAGTGAYLYGAPGTNAGMNPFGLNVVLSANMTAGQFLIGSLRGGATIYQRQGAVVEMGFVNDDFTKNLVTIRAEERLGLAVDRPAAIMYGPITAA
ncbi:phage major capsid protein [Pseudomonas sp. JS3066]|uniref:phage major capsid protein n=1 Tax=Pseudomonas sp. JS3066 TaxID=3090665 RepID=UPI002E7C0F3E|nr:phage major capsid protein [Pseudomonas sp. JS3066]WVK91142.1 phage major capsid protein [Pseudomonas sp. JS3066]